MKHMKTVVVSGATGFVGRNLVKYLAQKDITVYALVRNTKTNLFEGCRNVRLIQCELSDMAAVVDKLQNSKPDAFYHLAWQGAKGAGRADYVQQTQNAKYTCDAALVASRLNCGKFIAVGTITERLADEVLSEMSSAQNLMYGLTKSYTYKLLNIICSREQLNFVWAELSNIYGGDDDSGNLISYTMKCFEQGEVPSFGPCMNPYDFIHIDDVIGALYAIGEEQTSSGLYFVGRGEGKTLKEYIETVGRICQKEVKIGVRPDDGLRYKKEWFDNTRLVQEIGYQFTYSFEEGIQSIRQGRK